ncbi:zinc-dependent alcohol dehydrogenase family protein [Muriicola sp. Z0-33]|uniref:zinc-dependent alcohol dehydrogenase family protein n=1 Tax=Muriicola sp. Z0-33 TaxID=2816957 RepID=UPI002237D57A|nr:zinc-dependent alcohol dehydrogenase family protein [Muriicola sp. Z0-33]MCW5517883.1 zinc-dependent alcohol dehydrogenase family protein [Muriicola sp. Z0-33]
MKTRAAVLHQMYLERPYTTSKPLKIEEVELDAPGSNEVLVKIKAAGLCHSDLSVIDGNRPRPLPMALGHEAAGEVIALGDGVKQLKIGDHVVFAFLPSCGSCSYCKTGRAALCEPGAAANGKGTLLGGHRRIRKNNEYIHHHLGVSGFAEHAISSADSLVKIDPNIPFDIAALFGCAVLTGVGAVVNTAQLKFGDSILVVGLGGVGLSAILGAKAAGASKIIAADILPEKREVALALGAHHAIDASDKGALEQLYELTDGGVDISVEFAGAISALDFAFHATRRGGTTVTAALPHPDARLQLSPVTLVGQEKSLKGSYLGSCVPSRDIPAYIELYTSGRLEVDKLISHKLKLEHINEGFERLAAGEALRQIVVFDK